jgi:TATA-binding protein-associated factor Taf7
LEREFDLLKLSIDEIAALHERSAQSIMYKLDSEGLADYNVLAVCGTNYQLRDSDINNRHSNHEEEDEDEKDSDDSSDYEEELDNDDAASEVSDLEEDEDEEDKEEYDRFNVRQQINILSKQLANLTAIVYKVLSPKQGANRFNFEDLAGCR